MGKAHTPISSPSRLPLWGLWMTGASQALSACLPPRHRGRTKGSRFALFAGAVGSQGFTGLTLHPFPWSQLLKGPWQTLHTYMFDVECNKRIMCLAFGGDYD